MNKFGVVAAAVASLQCVALCGLVHQLYQKKKVEEWEIYELQATVAGGKALGSVDTPRSEWQTIYLWNEADYDGLNLTDEERGARKSTFYMPGPNDMRVEDGKLVRCIEEKETPLDQWRWSPLAQELVMKKTAYAEDKLFWDRADRAMQKLSEKGIPVKIAGKTIEVADL